MSITKNNISVQSQDRIDIVQHNFLNKVWKHQPPGFYCISTKSPSGKFKDHFFKDINEAAEFVNTVKDDHNVYFAPNTFSKAKRNKEFMNPSRLFYADLEGVRPSTCNRRPQIAWKSSDKRYSAIWVISTPIKSYTEYEDINQQITYINKADKSGWDCVQVLRCPGTKNFKYPNKPLSKVLWIEDKFYSSPQELLIKTSTLQLLNRSSPMVGTRSDMLWRLECELKEQGFRPEQIFELVKNSGWNKYKGRRDEDTRLKIELEKISKKTLNNKPVVETVIEYKPATRLSQVEPETIEWLWKPYIPKGKITVVEGDPGEGKSWFTLALAAEISRGSRMIGGTPGTCLMLNAEDGLGDTVKPRLLALNSNDENIYALEDPITFDDESGLDYFNHLVSDIKPQLVVVDPIVAYMSAKVDIFKANHTRQIMKQLKLTCELTNTAIIIVRHLTKSSRERMIYRGMGSIDITGAARSQLMIGANPENEEEKIIVQLKNSFHKKGSPYSYLVSNNKFKWIGDIEFDPFDWVEKPKEKVKGIKLTQDKPKPKARLVNGQVHRSLEGLKKPDTKNQIPVHVKPFRVKTK